MQNVRLGVTVLLLVLQDMTSHAYGFPQYRRGWPAVRWDFHAALE